MLNIDSTSCFQPNYWAIILEMVLAHSDNISQHLQEHSLTTGKLHNRWKKDLQLTCLVKLAPETAGLRSRKIFASVPREATAFLISQATPLCQSRHTTAIYTQAVKASSTKPVKIHTTHAMPLQD